MVKVGEYGSWESPLKSDKACDSSISLARMYCDRMDDGKLYWTELRPSEGGRTILFSKPIEGDVSTPAERWTLDENFDVYDMVHEYGGAAYFVHNGVAYCSNLKDNHIYKQTADNKTPIQVTQSTSDFRYADGEFSRADNFFFCIREDHTAETLEANKECQNMVIAVDTNTGKETVVASGRNFYSSPRVSPDGTKLVYVSWVHNNDDQAGVKNNMPWDDTELFIGDIKINGDSITVTNIRKIAGQEGVNFMEPRWTQDNRLLFISDPEKWWNLYMIENLETGVMKCVIRDLEQEIGQPCWDFGYRSFSPNPQHADQVVVLYGGKPALASLKSGAYTRKFDLRDDQHVSHCIFAPDGVHLFLQVVSPKEPAKIIKVNIKARSGKSFMTDFYHSAEKAITDEYLSIPQPITFDVKPGTGSEIKTAYGFYYPPKNADFDAPEGSLPPVLLKIHGGPTGSASMEMDLQKQYFTSRGIAIFDLNYRGSTGYGTAYRKELKKNWGVYDIQDSLDGALALCERGLVDRQKLLISGGSSGGYTTLACLTFDTNEPKVFAAGASYYGISDLEVLALNTHKFESHYTDEMIDEYPEEKQTYIDRSPIHNTETFNAPCAFFQGALDKVVPPEQSEAMFNVLKDDRKLPCSYVLFPDEEHGFKKSENKQKALDGEFYFYSQMLGFEPFDQDISIPIENMPPSQASKKQKR